MSERIFSGIAKEIIHEQWGAPMSFHRISRVEYDLEAENTVVVFSSFYSKAVAENGGIAMSNRVARLNGAEMVDEAALLQLVIDEPSTEFNEGVIENATE